MLRSHRTNLAVKVALGGILVVLFISVVNMQLNLKDLRERKAELAEEIAEVRNDIEEIDYRLSEEVDAAYIERYMRARGYRYPNEILFYNGIPD
ncbi:MAG: septum formation initiator family protein [Oscillospiraceae bacterium]|nr:septum formation initiator family protein [Oscillospiraceae bacterium]